MLLFADNLHGFCSAVYVVGHKKQAFACKSF